MSRIGKKPISLPENVDISTQNGVVSIKGPKGSLEQKLPPEVSITVEEKIVTLSPANDSQQAQAMWGLGRSLVQNMVTGVTEGYKVVLEIQGVGYRAAVKGKNLELNLGFSHPVLFPIRDGISMACPQPTTVEISGIDKQVVGQEAAKIRAFRKPEPYKGKGIRYQGEYVRRKEGKKK